MNQMFYIYIYRRITENDGLLEKPRTYLLSCTVQHTSFGIDYYLTEFIIIYLFNVHKCVLDRLCGLVARVSYYRSRGPGFDSLPYQFF
jgi:hypothetical protein